MPTERAKSKVTIFSESCKGVDDCGICRFVCPKDLFRACEQMNETGYYPPEIQDESECTGCQNCMLYCPDFAIAVEKLADPSQNQQEVEDEDK